MSDRGIFVTDANGTMYLAEPVAAWHHPPGEFQVFFDSDRFPPDAEPLYRLTPVESGTP